MNTITTPEHITDFRNRMIARGIQVELLGMKLCRGQSATAIAREMLKAAGLPAPRSKAAVLEAFKAAFLT
jgi:hypothetical protein